MAEELFRKLKKIRAFVFDFDGVMTDASLLLLENGEWLRRVSMRDGYAIQYATGKRYRVCIMSGSGSSAIGVRMEALGVKEIYFNVESKLAAFEKFLIDFELDHSEVLYMGDDIPDIEALKIAGISACPQDAAQEVKAVCEYIAEKNGGEGCVREVIEMVLKAHSQWQS